MTAPQHIADIEKVSDLLSRWITTHGADNDVSWLFGRREEIRQGAPEWKFFTAFSAVPRYLGKADLSLSSEDLAEARDARSKWNPSRWSIDQAARTYLVLALPSESPDSLVSTLDRVYSTADVGESVALYQSLPLVPHPDRFTGRAAEGIRSNMTSVFNAVALDNPYPAEYLDEGAWNQMVLKALFIGAPIHGIIGIDERANADLARMLVDYARERRAAARSVPPEVWRPVAPFVDDAVIDDIAAALSADDEDERRAAALALHASPSDSARRLLETEPDLLSRIERDDLTWSTLARDDVTTDK